MEGQQPTFRIYPYSTDSGGMKELKKQLKPNVLTIKLVGSSYVQKPEHIIINWGNGRNPSWRKGELNSKWINQPEKVRVAANKKKTLTVLRRYGVAVPDFTFARSDVLEWMREDPHLIVVGRAKVAASQGEGIHFIHPGHHVPTYPLYTKYVAALAEYRVHACCPSAGAPPKTLLVQKKERQSSTPERGAVIRNMANGYHFHPDPSPPEDVVRQGEAAVATLGLHFGAVDILYAPQGLALILEVNTAPGLIESTAVKYAKCFRQLASTM